MKEDVEKLGDNPVISLLIKMSLPIIFGLMVNGLYNVVDSIFVTRVVGSLGMGGVSVVFPIQVLVYSFAAMVGSGAASLISRRLGEKNITGAEIVSGNAIGISLVLSVCLTAGIYFFLDPLLKTLGSTPAIFPYAYDYALPIVMAIPMIIVLNVGLELLRAEGKMAVMAFVLIVCALLNIVLDAIFILWLDMGVQGAAVATILAQAFGFFIVMWQFYNKKVTVRLKFSNIGFQRKFVNSILALGVPSFMANVGVALTIGIVNYSLVREAGLDVDVLISAYGLNTRVTLFCVLPLIGLMLSFQTLVGYNYGAKNIYRVKQSLKAACMMSSIYAALITSLMVLFPKSVLFMFTDNQALLDSSADMAVSIFVGFVGMGVIFICGAYFQAIGRAKSAFFVSIFRVFIVFIPLVLLLPIWFGVKGVWLAFPAADFTALALCLVVLFATKIREARTAIAMQS